MKKIFQRIAMVILLIIATRIQAQWSLNGNGGTNAGINFIGTTDNTDLIFRRNNIRAGVLSFNNTAFGCMALYANSTGYYNTATGVSALSTNTTGFNNTAIGVSALYTNKTGNYNTANGVSALYNNLTGSANTAIGSSALQNNTIGYYNTATGLQALYYNTTGNYNIANGAYSLFASTTGNFNVALGYYSLFNHTTGDHNTAVGGNTGQGISIGRANTIIGANVSGLPAALSNTIILADGDGNQRLYINNDGNVGIGTTNPGNYKLNVWGSIRAHEIVVNTTGADFVFEENYRLRPLEEVAQFIWQNKYLPEITSAAEMQKDGVSVAELQVKLLQKIEELTLYMIQQHDKSILHDKRIEELANENNILKTLITNLQKQ